MTQSSCAILMGESRAVPAPTEPVAQSVEHLPFKQGAAGSSPARLTIDFKSFIPPQPIR